MMTLYLCYARTGKEFQVTDDLRLLGIDAWCGRCIKWKRVGKRRRPDPYEEPAIPNYIFAEMSPYDFHRAQQIKFLASTMTVVPHSAMEGPQGYNAFKKATERAYSEQDALRDKVEAPLPEFAPQASLQPVSGPFSDLLVRFRRIVNPEDPLNRKIEVDGPLGVMLMDPLDVRAAQ